MDYYGFAMDLLWICTGFAMDLLHVFSRALKNQTVGVLAAKVQFGSPEAFRRLSVFASQSTDQFQKSALPLGNALRQHLVLKEILYLSRKS